MIVECHIEHDPFERAIFLLHFGAISITNPTYEQFQRHT